jgi:hypothetical protein
MDHGVAIIQEMSRGVRVRNESPNVLANDLDRRRDAPQMPEAEVTDVENP